MVENLVSGILFPMSNLAPIMTESFIVSEWTAKTILKRATIEHEQR